MTLTSRASRAAGRGFPTGGLTGLVTSRAWNVQPPKSAQPMPLLAKEPGSGAASEPFLVSDGAVISRGNTLVVGDDGFFSCPACRTNMLTHVNRCRSKVVYHMRRVAASQTRTVWC